MPSIAYENYFTTGTVSVDSEDSDYLKENAYDWLTYPGDVWKPATSGTHYITVDMGSAVDADFWAVYGHDVDSIKLQYSSDNFAADINDVGTSVSPSGDEVIYKEFTSINARYWRLQVVKAASVSSIGLVMLGEKLTVPESVQVGFTPPTLTGGNDYMNSESEGGYFLGRSLIKNGRQFSLSFPLLTPSFIRDSWDLFIQHAEAKPFIFAWDYDNYPAEVAYCWTDKKIDVPNYHQPNFMQASLKVRARV